ncbi:MAG: ABC transporter substrate-binding protein [Oleispira sp.]|nr:ABC transporter substrate-binding protein [Oleispira sp.]
MPLSDCLPLLIAQDKGFFNQEGLKVELQMVMRSLFQMRCIVNFLNSARPSLIKQLP